MAEQNDERAELARLRRWKQEATLLFDGLQDLGRAFELPLGVLITGPVAIEAAENLLGRLAAAEATLARVEALADEWVAIARESRPHLGCFDMHRHLSSELRAVLAAEPDAGGEVNHG